MIVIDFSKLKKAGNKPGEYQGICPACGKRKFYINMYSGFYICFRESCGIKGSIKENSRGSFEISPSDRELVDRVNLLFSIQSPTSIDLDKFSIPFEKELSYLAYVYIRDRGFTQSDISKLNLRLGIEYLEDDNLISKWKNRIVFPYYDSGIPLYAIGRTFTDRLPKYMNTQLSKSVILYNHESIQDTVIICEGLLSAFSAEKYSGVPSVPLLGTQISDYQAYLISKARDIFISLDGGVSPDKVFKKLEKYNRNIYHINLPEGRDPDELKDSYLQYFQNAKKISGLLFPRRNYS